MDKEDDEIYPLSNIEIEEDDELSKEEIDFWDDDKS